MGSILFIDAIRRRKDEAMQAAWDNWLVAKQEFSQGDIDARCLDKVGRYAMDLIAQRNRDYMAARNGCKAMVVAS